MKTRFSLRTLVIYAPIAMVYYPCVLLGFLLLMMCVLGGAFLIECSLENTTNHTVWVTPVGTAGPQGSRYLLPMYRQSWPKRPTIKRSHYQVKPGERFVFVYDFDDINFSELVIEDKTGIVGQIVVNPTPTRSQYSPPAQTDYVLSPTTPLAPVPANVAAVVTTARPNTRLLWSYVVCIPAFFVEIGRGVCKSIRSKKREAPQSAPPADSVSPAST